MAESSQSMDGPDKFEQRLLEAVTDAVRSGVEVHKVWSDHLAPCQQCRLAIRGRFASATITQMAAKCCDVGKPLYLAFIQRI